MLSSAAAPRRLVVDYKEVLFYRDSWRVPTALGEGKGGLSAAEPQTLGMGKQVEKLRQRREVSPVWGWPWHSMAVVNAHCHPAREQERAGSPTKGTSDDKVPESRT